jgi:hypothetical protein
MTEDEMAAIQARAEREGWDQHTMCMVLLGKMKADDFGERTKVTKSAEALRGRPIDQWPKIEVLNRAGIPGGSNIWKDGAMGTKKRSKPYPLELRERAVRLVREQEAEHASQAAAIR